MLSTFLTVAFVAANTKASRCCVANLVLDVGLLCSVITSPEIWKTFVRRRYSDSNLLEMAHFDNCDRGLLHTVNAVLPFSVFKLLEKLNPPRNNNCLELVAVQNVPLPKRRICPPSMSKPLCEKRQGTISLVSRLSVCHQRSGATFIAEKQDVKTDKTQSPTD